MDNRPIEELEVSGCGDLVIGEDGTINRIPDTYFTRCRRMDGGRRLEIVLEHATGPCADGDATQLDDRMLSRTLRRVHLSGYVCVTLPWSLLSTESVDIETRNASELGVNRDAEQKESMAPVVSIRAHERSTVTCRGRPYIASAHVKWWGDSRVTFFPTSLGDNFAEYYE